jgi:hypothetical protein
MYQCNLLDGHRNVGLDRVAINEEIHRVARSLFSVFKLLDCAKIAGEIRKEASTKFRIFRFQRSKRFARHRDCALCVSS